MTVFATENPYLFFVLCLVVLIAITHWIEYICDSICDSINKQGNEEVPSGTEEEE